MLCCVVNTDEQGHALARASGCAWTRAPRARARSRTVAQSVLSKCIASHGRIGHAQASQVPHPAAPEWAAETAQQCGWIEAIWRSRMGEGGAASGGDAWFTPEFGPRPYMPALPFTNAPTADLDECNDWMAKWAREAFAELLAESAAGVAAAKSSSAAWRPPSV